MRDAEDKNHQVLAADKKQLAKMERRIVELDTIIQRLYEDICCKGRKSKIPSNTVTAAGSSVAV